VSDSRRTTASHLGRAYAGAYHGDGECAGVLGVEFGALVRPATSGGAFSGNGTGGAAAAAARTEEGGRGADDRMEGVFWGRGSASQPGGGGGRPRRAQRRRTAATWPSRDGARQAPRAGERGEGEAGRAAGWAERETGLAQQRLSPFLFFLKFFSQFLSKFIWTI